MNELKPRRSQPILDWRRSVLLAVLVLAMAGLLGEASAQVATAEVPNLQLATFDTAWKLINDRFWDPDFGGVDWQAVREELRPQAAEAANAEELREVLNEMISRLGQSHFGVIPATELEPATTSTEASEADDGLASLGSATLPEADSGEEEVEAEAAPTCREDFGERLLAALRSDPSRGEATPGFDVRLVEGEILVSRVEEGGPADRAGIMPGWKLLQVGGQPLEDVPRCLGAELEPRAQQGLIYELVSQLLEGESGEPVHIELSDSQAELRDFELRRQVPKDAQTVRFGNLPPMQFRFASDWLETENPSVRIGVVRFNVWMMPVAEAFERAVIEMKDADGIIVDLRGNPGGMAGLSAGLAGYFVDTAESLGTLKYRRDQLHLRINPRRVSREGKALEIYDGHLAILIDQFTASTSEIFSAGLQDLGRARLFGQRSAAAALPAVVERLPNGDLLMHALADLERPSGKRIEGVGVSPDEEVSPTREGLSQGVDEVLERAAAWITQTVQRARSHAG